MAATMMESSAGVPAEGVFQVGQRAGNNAVVHPIEQAAQAGNHEQKQL
jgi:hypothetical protein